MNLIKKISFVLFFLILTTNILKAENRVSYLDIDFIITNTLAGKKLLVSLKKEEELTVNKFKLYCDNKTLIAGNTEIRNNIHNFLDNIHNSSIQYIKDDDKNIVNQKTNNGKYYFWFSDMCIYDRKILPNFFQYINFNNFNNFIKNMSFWSFDYIIYCYYCIVKYNYKIILETLYIKEGSSSLNNKNKY